jgi:excisionase family DNA binding protein
MTKIKINAEISDAYSITEAQDLLNKGYATIYRWINTGKIQTVKISNRTLIPKSEIDRINKEK